MKTNILFVRGFNTKLTDIFDGYVSIKNVYPDMTYFDYSPEDDLIDVYNRLQTQIKKVKYTHLIGHSMGGGLLMRYMYNHKVSNDVKIILLMPLIYKEPIKAAIAKIPFASKIRFPKGLLIPNSNLYDQGSFVNDTFKLVPLSQVSQMYNNIMLEPKEFIAKLNTCSNCVLFYASKDLLSPIPESFLSKIKNIERIDGLHEAFNSVGTSNNFFKKLAQYI
jgi:pimeloyl-ACP methyl ester carboxylesterase